MSINNIGSDEINASVNERFAKQGNNNSILVDLLENITSKEKFTYEEKMFSLIIENLLRLDRKQLGKTYKYIRRVIAGLEL